MDCDASLDPRELRGSPTRSRPAPPTSCSARAPRRRGAWPRTPAWPTALLALELRRRAGVALTDLGPMRAARREELLELEIADRRFGWPLEMVLRAAAARLADRASAPSPYLPRAGRSKVTGTVRGTVRAVRDMAAVLA